MPAQATEEHRRFIERMGLDIRGRIYISSQGMNCQYGGTLEHCTAYVEWVKQQPGFQVGGGPPVKGRGRPGVGPASRGYSSWKKAGRVRRGGGAVLAIPRLPERHEDVGGLRSRAELAAHQVSVGDT